MSVGQYDSPKHLNFLHNQHNRQQDELNRNILDRLNTLQNQKMRSFSSKKMLDSGHNDDFKENLRQIANMNIENLKKLEQSNRGYWEQLYDKMRNMENKMLRMFKDKEQAMSYLDLRIGSIESSQKAVADIMRKLMDQQNEKYSGVSLLEQRLKQIEHRFELKDQKQSDSLKILQEQISMKIDSKIGQVQRNFEATIQHALEQSKNSSPQRAESENNYDVEGLAQTVRMMQMEFKENRRKVLSLEDKFGSIETDMDEIQEKIKKVSKQLENLKNTSKNVSIPATTHHHQIQEPLHKRGESSYRRNSDYDSSEKRFQDQPRTQFRGISEVRKQSHQMSDPSEQDDPFQQMGNMRGGIRGLLQKSKEKQQKIPHNSLPKSKATLAGLGPNMNEPKGLPRQKSLAPVNPLARGPHKGLPPVKADQKKVNQQMYESQSEQEEDGQVYGVDQEGYLLDEEGNYIMEYGERVQLSEEDFLELMKQQNG